MEQLPILPIGVCKPIKQKYDMDRQILPFQVSGFSFVQDVFRDHELTISADRHQAKQICQNMGLWRVYGGAQYDKGSCLIKAKSIINGKIQKTVQKGSDKISAVHANVGDRQSAKFTASSGTQTYTEKRQHQADPKQDIEVRDFKDASAQNNLGNCYYYGDGVKKDYAEAVKWYRKAADQGDADAQYNLGDCYCSGKGIEQDYAEAVKWYRKAADQGDADAQYNLGICYDTGRGVEQDYAEAAKWYRKAADQGVEEAKEKLESFGKKSSSGCFITTAVCQTFGKPDDCYELTMFRRFRDMWLSKQPGGKSLISEYYAVAPAIVENIDGSADAEHVYQKIWELYLNPCLHYLENEQYEDCKNLYVDMVTRLKKRVS